MKQAIPLNSQLSTEPSYSLLGTSASLKDRIRIRLKKKAIEILPQESSASISIEDGDPYHGGMIVNADGSHSIARLEHWRVSERGAGAMTLEINLESESILSLALLSSI